MLRDYEYDKNLGWLKYYTLKPHKNHSVTEYSRRYKSSLDCSNKYLARTLGWIYIKTGLFLYD